MKLRKLLLGFTCATLFTGTVYAEDTEYVKPMTENTIKLETYMEHPGDITNGSIRMSNYVEEENTSYYLAMTNGDMPEIPVDSNGYCDIKSSSSHDDFRQWQILGSNGLIYNEWFMLKGYQNAYVVKRTSEGISNYKCEYTKNPIVIEKPALNAIGTKYSFFLFGKGRETINGPTEKASLSVFQHYPDIKVSEKLDIAQDAKRYVKVGIVNDSDLIYKLTRNKPGALEELMEYAKDNDGIEWSISNGVEADPGINEDFSAEDGKYYFMYVYYKDSAYREELNDVMFTYAEDHSLFSYTDYITDDVENSAKPKEVKQEAVSNPKTGIEDYIIEGIILISVLIIIAQAVNKKDLFKQI